MPAVPYFCARFVDSVARRAVLSYNRIGGERTNARCRGGRYEQDDVFASGEEVARGAADRRRQDRRHGLRQKRRREAGLQRRHSLVGLSKGSRQRGGKGRFAEGARGGVCGEVRAGERDRTRRNVRRLHRGVYAACKREDVDKRRQVAKIPPHARSRQRRDLRRRRRSEASRICVRKGRRRGVFDQRQRSESAHIGGKQIEV